MQTLWNSRDTLPAYPPLREDLHADAAVVGGGMAGILTAYALHTRGLRVVLLEGSRLASGVTAHTTAKITAQHGRFCERLVHDFGFHLAQQYLRANLCAVRQFRALVRQKRIDCGFSDESSFIYAAPDGPSLTRELEYALSLGAPARLVKPEGLPFPVREALCFERQAQLSPLPFLAALLPELTVYEHSPVRDIRGHAVRCDGGTVTAEQIVVATHDKFVIYKQIQTTVRTFEIYVIFSVRIFNYIFRLIHAAWIILSYIRRIIRKRVTHIGVLVTIVTEYLPARRHFDIGRRGAGKRLVGYFVEIGKLPVGKQSDLRRSKFVVREIFVGKRYIKTTCGQCADLGCEGVVVVVLHSAVLSLSDFSINVGVYVKNKDILRDV